MDKQVVGSKSEDVTETDEAEKELEEVRLESKKHRLAASEMNKYHTEIQEIFKQVKINIPLLDAVQQVSLYIKFLNDLCIVKKKAFLTEQVSALILNKTPQKFGDPSSPHISIMIGESRIERALLDLRSSVNLLPFSVYEQLELGKLKKTFIILLLAHRSVKVPRGIVEDVLVYVDKFYYLVDFVVFDIQQPISTIHHAPVILRPPFLVTSNALINCRSGVLNLIFGNMTLEINVFNACKIPSGCGNSDVHVVDMVYDFDISELLSVFDYESASEDGFPEQSKVLVETIPTSLELT
ncbi:uncharacterized protein LOC122296874 [Carya illinoinensis]|uniref:uncharacterized protein LOC122296874 n=1 Tax=Carya illinoinensis TaxID=32201 RepID=UPI001C728D7C|nr:uncharacterized protein LOC122296874 [Carya illinoinensis]